ncbi:MAG: YHS domain-containing (seleno)protein [Pseudomonadota bacterium]
MTTVLRAMLLVLAGLWAGAVYGDPINTGPSGIALSGYDVTSYFGAAGPQPGSYSFQARHDGATYLFASAANRARFLATPERYLPAYGGHCSLGVTAGEMLEVDPTAYRVVNGRLFLQLDHGTRMIWMLDEKANIAVADTMWPTVVTLSELRD